MTGDLLLVIDHRDTQLTLEGRALRVQIPGSKPQHVPLGVLALVVVHGRPLVGCDVWRALAERHIPAVLQSARGQGACTWIGAALGSTGVLRAAQHRASERADLRLRIARRLIRAKLSAQRQAAERLICATEASGARAGLRQRLDEAELQLDGAPSLGALMGVEGAAAAAWFHWLATWLPAHWQFQSRNRRPPRDPLNALLSLGYTLLGGDMLAAVQRQGLDPARGLLHELVPGRESLVLDLIEPLRPTVDVVMLGLLDTLFEPDDFTTSAEDGCRLSKDARGRFYRVWAKARQDWPDLSAPPNEATNGEEPPPVSLAQLCHRQTEALRQDLQRVMP